MWTRGKNIICGRSHVNGMELVMVTVMQFQYFPNEQVL